MTMPIARKLICLAVGAAVGSSAWGQAPPPGTYQFTSGPGVGTPPFTVSGFSTSLGGSVSGAHLPFCSGVHVHGTFNGFADPMSGGCGHGIIQLLVPPPPVSGGSSLVNPSGSFPGGMPTNVAGQLALSTPRGGILQGFSPDAVGDALMLAIAGFGYTLDARDRMARPGMLGASIFWNYDERDLTTQVQEAARSMRQAIEKWHGSDPAGAPAVNVVQTTLADPAQRMLSSPLATSGLEDLAAFNLRDAEGYRREVERTRAQAEEYRKLAEDARQQAERNRQRAEDARKEGREGDAKGWDAEAERDRAEAERREAEARRIDRWSEEQQRREEQSRELARERREAAERAREQARQTERDRAERVRREAEEKARVAREEREARRAKEQAEREARRQAAEERERAREREIARQRAAREREHRAQLDAEQRARDQRARGSSSDADLAKAAADRKKKKEEEEKASLLDRFADLVVGALDGSPETPEEKLLAAAKEKLQEKLEEKLQEEALKRAGLDKAKEKLDEIKEQLKEELASKLDDLGLDAAAGKLGEGIDTIKKIKEIGDWMNAELDKNAGRQRRQMSKVDMLSDPKSRPERLRGASSGTIAGQDVLDVYKGAVEILKPQ
jgi:hypothetical protein